MASSKLILRAVKAAESSWVHAAYEKWSDAYVLPRPEADYRAAAEKGLFFVVEQEGLIVAATGVYDLIEGSKVETGSTFVEPSIRGFRIQQLFFQVRIANVVVSQGTSVEITTAVNPTNTPSLENARKAGFTQMTPVAEQIAPCDSCPKKKQLGPGRVCCCDFWTLSIERRREAVQLLLDRTETSPSIELPHKDGRKLHIEVHGRIVSDSDTRIALRDFINGKDW